HPALPTIGGSPDAYSCPQTRRLHPRSSPDRLPSHPSVRPAIHRHRYRPARLPSRTPSPHLELHAEPTRTQLSVRTAYSFRSIAVTSSFLTSGSSSCSRTSPKKPKMTSFMASA